MIDLESDVFDYLAKILRAKYSKIFVTGEYVEAPASFPAVTIVEADNRIVDRMRTLHIENAVSVMYEINIYSNKSSGKKAEAKAIANTLDEAMAEKGFTRSFREQIPNLKDATIYRIVIRYQGVIGRTNNEKYLIYQS